MKQQVMYLTGPEAIEIREEPMPVPGAGEIVVRIQAATTCGTDVKTFRRGGHPRMLQVPTPFGHEFAGSVAAVGENVSLFSEGDRVVVTNSAPCHQCEYCAAGRENLCKDLHYLNGAYAEFLLIPQRFVDHSTYQLDPEVSYDVAALTEPLACVIHGVNACELGEGSDVLVYGAGPIGLLMTAVLCARRHRVVVADPNSQRLSVASLLGASSTVKVKRGGDQAKKLRQHSSDGDGFHCTIDATGVPEVWADAIACVRPGGLVNLFGGCPAETTVPFDTQLIHYSELTIKGVYHHRPATVSEALGILKRKVFDPSLLLSTEMPLHDLDKALRAMMAKEALKVVIHP